MSKRQQRLQAEVGEFMHQYGRQKQAGQEPNDRSIERAIKRMDPRDLDSLMRGEDWDGDEFDEPWL